MATFEPPSAEKLIFSDKTLACLIDCTPKHMSKEGVGSILEILLIPSNASAEHCQAVSQRLPQNINTAIRG